MIRGGLGAVNTGAGLLPLLVQALFLVLGTLPGVEWGDGLSNLGAEKGGVFRQEVVLGTVLNLDQDLLIVCAAVTGPLVTYRHG